MFYIFDWRNFLLQFNEFSKKLDELHNRLGIECNG